MIEHSDGITERRCDVCGKNVAYTCELDQWTYKLMRNNRIVFCCSYRCYRKEKAKIRKYNIARR